MGILIYNGKYQEMDKAPFEMAALKDYYYTVYFDSSGFAKIGEEAPNLLKDFIAGMQPKP